MAAPGAGLGYRTACDILMEVSFHLLQPTVITQVTGVTSATGGYGEGGYGAGGYGGGANATVAVQSTYAMYPGAMVVVGWNAATAEVTTVIDVIDDTHFTCALVNAHVAGETVLGPTFPVQQTSDPIFTQSEMLGYLARAQNEFLTAVPCYYQRFFQDVQPGVLYQDTPPTALLVDRVAASAMNIPIVSLTRLANTVTIETVVPHGLTQYSTFMVTDPNSNPPANITDATFKGGAFAVISVPTDTTFTYRQDAADATATGGVVQAMLRLYEVSQEDLTMQDRFWQSNFTGPLQNWFEDRAGLYKWGVGGQPSTLFPVELLCAVRDSDTLALLDQFLLPDMVLHGVKYLTLAYSWLKDGIQQNPQMANFAMQRYTQVVMATQRYIKAMAIEVSKNA